MNIQPQTTQLQQRPLSNDLTINTSDPTTNATASGVGSTTTKNLSNQGVLYFSSPSSNNATGNSQLNNVQNTFTGQQVSSPMAVKQPLQQQGFQQFANQNNSEFQQQFQQPQVTNNLKYYMTNSPASSPVNQLQPNLSASPRILNFNNSNSGGQQAYVLQDQQNNLNLMNNVNTNHTGFSNGINGSNMVLNSAGQATNAQGTVQNSNGQIFLNINNRIVPIQTLNVKQTSNSNPTGGSPGAVGNVIQQNSSQVQSTGQRVQIISAINNNSQSSHQSQMIQIRPNSGQNVDASNSPSVTYKTSDSQSQQPPITANYYSTNSTANPITNSLQGQNLTGNFGAEITEKMRQLENIQKQLRTYQVKIASTNNPDTNTTDPTKSSTTPTSYTSQQIQSALTLQEQALLQNLIIQRKTVQTEIQSLQQKLLTPHQQQSEQATVTPATPTPNNSTTILNTATSSVSSVTNPAGNVTNTASTNLNPLTKLQLYQQVLIKLNNFKNSKTVTIPGSTDSANTQQQLQLTIEEFEQLKKLLELQNQLQNELSLTQTQITTIQTNLTNANLISKPIANQTIQIVNSSSSSSASEAAKKAPEAAVTASGAATTGSTKMSDWSLQEKNKVMDLIKAELNKLKVSLSQLGVKQQQGGSNLQEILTQQQQIKDRYVLLVKKQSELQTLIVQSQACGDKQQPKQSSATSNSLSDSIEATIASVSQKFSQSSGATNQQQLSISQQPGPGASQTIHIVNSTSNIGQNSPKQTPIKIRNLQNPSTPTTPTTSLLTNVNKPVNSPTTVIQRTVGNVQHSPATPLRAVVINNSSAGITPVASVSSLVPLAQVAQMQKQYFSHVKFKCLSFEELGQHGIITKTSDNATIELIKELDNRAAQLVNPEQISSFAKNQVKLVKKFLEQQQLLKTTIRTRFQNQLFKEHNALTEPTDLNKLPFTDTNEAIKRLAPFHCFQKPVFEPSNENHKKFDECFENVSEKLMKKADAMKKRFHLFQLRSMQKEVESTEATLIMKLFVDDLKQSFEAEKRQHKEDQERIIKEEQTVEPAPKKPSPTSFKHLILKNSGMSSAANINDDFDICYQSNPLKRQLKTEEFEDDPDDFQDESSTHRMIKHHSPNFTNKLLQTTNYMSNHASAASSSDASSSSTSLHLNIPTSYDTSTSVSVKPEPITSNVNSQMNTSSIKLTTQHSSTINDQLTTEQKINFSSNNKNNQNNDRTNNNTFKELPTDENAIIMNEDLSEPNNSAPMNMSGLDELVLNEEDLAVQNILDY